MLKYVLAGFCSVAILVATRQWRRYDTVCSLTHSIYKIFLCFLDCVPGWVSTGGSLCVSVVSSVGNGFSYIESSCQLARGDSWPSRAVDAEEHKTIMFVGEK